MGLIQSALDKIGLASKADIETRLARAYEEAYFDANDEPPSGTLKSYGYKRQTSGGLRDFTKMSHDQILDVVWTLYQSNPIAKRYLQLKRDYIIGHGIGIDCEDESLDEILKTFASKNKLHSNLKKWVLQKHLWGEQLFPAFVRQADGAVRLGYIDPGEIEHVVCHPDNVMEPWVVVLKFKIEGNSRKRIYRIIREDEDYVDGDSIVAAKYDGKLVTAEQANLQSWEVEFLRANNLDNYTGSVFYFTINNVSNQPRGFSDLLQVADWLDSHDETLFSLADREQFAGYFSWFVKLIGSSEEDVRKRAATIRKSVPKRGSVNVSNDTEEWELKVADLKQTGSISTADALEMHALGGLGIPRHWYAHGDRTNLATAKEQNEAVWRTMESDQDGTKDAIAFILQFVRDQAEIAGYYTAPEDIKITVIMPEMSDRNTKEAAETITSVVNALVAVKDLNLITKERQAEIFSKAVDAFGIQYDFSDELEAAQEQADGEEETTADMVNKWLNGQLQQQQNQFGGQNEPGLPQNNEPIEMSLNG